MAARATQPVYPADDSHFHPAGMAMVDSGVHECCFLWMLGMMGCHETDLR
jgi:hypothetical protein